MELKGSKTEQNLWTAFAGESQARVKDVYKRQVLLDAGQKVDELQQADPGCCCIRYRSGFLRSSGLISKLSKVVSSDITFIFDSYRRI